MADPIRVAQTREENGLDRDGKPYSRIVVTFYDGDHGPFTHTFEKAGFNGVTARLQLDTYVRELRALRG
jgi:hypothetical protein